MSDFISLKKQILNQKFDKLTVIEEAPSYKHKCKKTGKVTSKAMWLCICECGNKTKRSSTHLQKGKQNRCKSCAYASRPQSIRRLSALERIFRLKVVRNAKKRNIPVEIDHNQYFNIAKNNCNYCDSPPEKINVYENKHSKSEYLYINGIDRVDTNKGYSLDNIVSCCKFCNTAKLDNNLEYFKNKIIKIYNHLKLKKD